MEELKQQFISSINSGVLPSIGWFYNYASYKGVKCDINDLQTYLSFADKQSVIEVICVDLQINRLFSKDDKLIMLI
jgi:hypothetical protein